jgi:hypothetical protein
MTATVVLHNPEVLERILQYLSGSKQTLVSASLTAKAFSEPAFNVLWYEIDTIWPLFHIIPTFKRTVNGKYVSLHLMLLVVSERSSRCSRDPSATNTFSG